MNRDFIIREVEKRLPEKRRRHTYGVRDTAVLLAERYGADPKKAELAALCHDLYRYVEGAELADYVREFHLPERYLTSPNLAHSKIAAAVMKRDFGIEDEDLLNAVSYHTTGRAGMSLLEKIVFLADAIEPGRDYPGVGELRKTAEENLDSAVLQSLEGTIRFLEREHTPIDEDTIKARNDLSGKEEKKGMTESKSIALLAAETLDAKKARDIVLIDISEKASFADYFVIASGGSERQIGMLSEEVDDRFAKEGILLKSVEGKPASGWILLDFGDVIVNVLTAEMRERYNIEKVWGDCACIQYEEGTEK